MLNNAVIKLVLEETHNAYIISTNTKTIYLGLADCFPSVDFIKSAINRSPDKEIKKISDFIPDNVPNSSDNLYSEWICECVLHHQANEIDNLEALSIHEEIKRNSEGETERVKKSSLVYDVIPSVEDVIKDLDGLVNICLDRAEEEGWSENTCLEEINDRSENLNKVIKSLGATIDFLGRNKDEYKHPFEKSQSAKEE